MMALFLCLVALVPVALAIELPPSGSVAQIQTSGPNADLGVGDWYTNNTTTGLGYHSFEIIVPCTVSRTQVITVDLFDPGVWNDGSPDELDEIRDLAGAKTSNNAFANDAIFTLFDPSDAQIISRSYPPSATTSGVTDTLASFTVEEYGCGVYTLRAETTGNDDNAWRLVVTPDGLDTPLPGDEISLGNLQTSFQHQSFGCQTFHFFVPDTMTSILLSNFDMDFGRPGMCDPICSVVYDTPMGVFSGSASGSTEWNNGGDDRYPPPGGDAFPDLGRGFPDPEPGWWEAELCLDDDNQYIFDPGGLPYFYNQPDPPNMTVGKDDGTTTYYPGGVLEYTITYANTGTGPALDVVLTDRLPPYTRYLSCSGGQSCGETPSGSGIVIFSLGTVQARESGSVTVRAEVDADAPTGDITNTVELNYTDILFSDYPVLTATDVDSYTVAPPPPPPPPPPDDDGEPPSEPGLPPTPAPIPPTPVPPTPTVEVVTVARLPETGGFPGWFPVVLGVPILIGAAGLLNLARLEMRGRRGGRKKD
jgi:uncharacterized repeat protein (TIGR01451 family)